MAGRRRTNAMQTPSLAAKFWVILTHGVAGAQHLSYLARWFATGYSANFLFV